MAPTDLGALFLRSGGAPISWNGELVHLSFDCRVPTGHVKFRWVDAAEAPIQAICMRVLSGTVRGSGGVWTNVVLWRDTSPDSVECEVTNEEGAVVRVWNGWRDPEYKTLQAGISSAGLKVSELPNGWRFDCNDGWHEPAFRDLVFELTYRPLQRPR